MNKLQKYNNIIFAIFGTLGIILASFGIYQLIKDFIPRSHNQNAVISSDKVAALSADNKFQKILDFNLPIELDSTKGYYLFSIDQKTLHEPKQFKRGETVSDYYESMPLGGGVGSRAALSKKIYFGNFNNFIFSENCNSNFRLLFQFRVSANRVEYFTLPSSPLLIMRGASIDTDKDGVLTQRDMQELYIYNILKDTLVMVQNANSTIIDFKYLHHINKFIIKYGVDDNNDGTFNYLSEPSVLKSYDFTSNKLESILDSSTVNHAFEILAGKNGTK
ncbi:MAG: hypothetical protein A2268_10870 [Candidatus Raymondbacteria bacterium RifOxyA12_full_50_37]|uniref:Uncharacterized protein n=1 Tax=Candidatus Raymondbacteria bacterium RIFOXYD12_FULL_49_13 TaxID=1817890 RepID=A0A1F7F1Y4_UNCRA|nr:MAG: hypothetical protein A2268_10870 [Candidatus Raymondbacteria bacterium RifOxyA12_full_50_37]OGJ85513.1 MAG: hypothetical protein A2248_12655 [Candidatus Raymondbacteria bacterium RIFOXYA2_FULL_49_16]OGJ95016.1 MAG: hypothetical protein A2453_07355 [Candidatus Raymondbacteria bacterium RIFOXYC2_FULL_50_21]OGK00680.1 MAG: hypothetical protein A2519_19990 [Candidatus Raymondbacteria bacterium RIFOXYD12_FULL_49_13]OGK01285.1 MAG: hypothetical protein A2350_08345 [Candidatus Raymondbacteria 